MVSLLSAIGVGWLQLELDFDCFLVILLCGILCDFADFYVDKNI